MIAAFRMNARVSAYLTTSGNGVGAGLDGIIVYPTPPLAEESRHQDERSCRILNNFKRERLRSCGLQWGDLRDFECGSCSCFQMLQRVPQDH